MGLTVLDCFRPTSEINHEKIITRKNERKCNRVIPCTLDEKSEIFDIYNPDYSSIIEDEEVYQDDSFDLKLQSLETQSGRSVRI